MYEEVMDENKRFLPFERLQDEPESYPSSKLRKLYFLSPPLYQELRHLYLICLHVILVFLSVGLILNSFQKQNVPYDSIYSK
jgi:hypothetical protein